MSFTVILYFAAVLGLVASLVADVKKTKMALKKAYKAFMNIFADFALVLLLVGLLMTYVSPELIGRFIGQESGVLGIVIASVVGAVTLIPGFVAFPMAASLLERGAGLVPIAAFVATLMMVGIVTLPVEIRYFGKKFALIRNAYSFVYAIIVALTMGVLLK